MSKACHRASVAATRAGDRAPTRRAGRQRRPSKPLPQPDAPDHLLSYPDASNGLGCPLQIIDFPDAFAIWLRSPMDAADLAHLRSLCGGKPRIENRTSRIDPELIQRLVLRQPSREAIEWLARRNDVHFNYAELARDLIYRSTSERDEAFRFHLAHVLRKDRRGQQMTICFGEDGQSTAYDAKRSAKSRLVAYPCVSKMAKAPALHIEERDQGPQMLKRKGISLRDLLSFDHLRFWNDNLHYYRIADVEGLGRAYFNYLERRKDPTSKSRRKSRIKKITDHISMNIDNRTGHLLIRTLGYFSAEQIKLGKKERKAGLKMEEMLGYEDIYAAISIQNVYDRLNHFIPMDRFMERISVSANSEIIRYMRGGGLEPAAKT
ncbi:hypothetical protein AB8Z38_22170 [Bradyrhizobium sp. LLZ17]|uniref:Uncharacterized protein n=1 Tax=Bradyrhizobium sp. LLZ17 TaxID=3239388 RepID=A0AB39XCH6_9BRAD